MNFKIQEMERWLKRSLKNKISINKNTVISYMMKGMAGLFTMLVLTTNSYAGFTITWIDSSGYAKGTNKPNIRDSIGIGSDIEGINAVVIGAKSTSAKESSVSIGFNITNNATSTVAIGRESSIANAASQKGVVIGMKAKITGNSQSSTAIGYNSEVSSGGALAIGAESTASGFYSTAIGGYAKSKGRNSIAVGIFAETGEGDNAKRAIAIGSGSSGIPNEEAYNGAKAERNDSIAIGTGANSQGESSVAIGKKAVSNGLDSIAIGTNAQAKLGSFAFGSGAIAETNINKGTSVAIGKGAHSQVGWAIAIGEEAKAYESAVSIGNSAISKGASVAIGRETEANKYSTTIGVQSKATGLVSLALGFSAIAKNLRSTAIGAESHAEGKGSVSIGALATSRGSRSIAIGGIHEEYNGTPAYALADDAVAIGTGSNAAIQKAVALGSFSKATRDAGALGYDSYSTNHPQQKRNENSPIWKATHAAIAIGNDEGNNSVTRQITGLAAGTNDTDAVNVAQLKRIITRYVSINSDDNESSSNFANKGATGTDAVAIGKASEAKGNYSTAIGYNSKATDLKTTVIGESSNAAGGQAIAIGSNVKTLKQQSIGIGNDIVISGDGAIGIGGDDSVIYNNGMLDVVKNELTQENKNATVDGNYTKTYANGTAAIAIGMSTLAVKNGATAVGTRASAVGEKAVALGFEAVALKDHSTALGEGARATALESFAGSINARATGEQSIALGHYASTGKNGSWVTDDKGSKGEYSIAIGSHATVTGDESIYIGRRVNGYTTSGVSGNKSIGIGYNNNVHSDNAIVLGSNTTIAQEKNDAIAIGNTVTVGNPNVIAIGKEAKANGTNTVSIGLSAEAAANLSVAIGNASKTEGTNSTAVGNSAHAGNWATAYGNQSNASKDDAVAVGNTALASGNNSTAIGAHTNASAVGAIAIGGNNTNRATASATNAISIGANSTNKEDAIAIGRGASVSNNGGVAIGEGSQSLVNSGVSGYDLWNQTNSGAAWVSTKAAFAVGTSANTRQITGVAAGTQDTDAVNVAQLKRAKVTISGNSGSHQVLQPTDGNIDFINGSNTTAVVGTNNTVKYDVNDLVTLGKSDTELANAGLTVQYSANPNANYSKLNGDTLEISRQKNGQIKTIKLGMNNDNDGYLIGLKDRSPITTDQNNAYFANYGSETGRAATEKAVSDLANSLGWEIANGSAKVGDVAKLSNGAITKKQVAFKGVDKKTTVSVTNSDKGYDVTIGLDDEIINKINNIDVSAKANKDGNNISSPETWRNNLDVYSKAEVNGKGITFAGDTGSQKINLEGTLGIKGSKDTNNFGTVTKVDEKNVTVSLTDATKQALSKVGSTETTVNALKDNKLTFAASSGNEFERKNSQDKKISIIEADFENSSLNYKKENLKTVIETSSDGNTATIKIGLKENLGGIKSVSDGTNKITLNDNGAVKLANASNGTVKLTGLSDGTISDTSTDAVTGKQLKALEDKAISFAGNDNSKVNKKLGETLNIVGEGTLEGETSANNIKVSKKDEATLEIKLAKNLVGISSISNGDNKITLEGNKITLNKPIYVDGNKVVTENNVSALGKLTYKANSKGSNTVGLTTGLDFIGDDNITSSAEGEGKVKYALKKDLTIDSIAKKDGAKITLGTDSITLDKNGKVALKGVADGKEKGDAVSYDQLKAVVDSLGGDAKITDGKVISPTYSLKAGGNHTTVGEALGAIDTVSNTNKTDIATLKDNSMTFNASLNNTQVTRKNSETKSITITEGDITDSSVEYKGNNLKTEIVLDNNVSKLKIGLRENLEGIKSIKGSNNTITLDDTTGAIKLSNGSSNVKLTGVANGTTDYDAVNYSQLQTKVDKDEYTKQINNINTTLGDKINTSDADGRYVSNNNKLIIKDKQNSTKEIEYNTEISNLQITGDKNINTTISGDTLTVSVVDKPTFEAATIAGVSFGKDDKGTKLINADGAKIVAIADGEIKEGSGAAVNGGQLYKVDKKAEKAQADATTAINDAKTAQTTADSANDLAKATKKELDEEKPKIEANTTKISEHSTTLIEHNSKIDKNEKDIAKGFNFDADKNGKFKRELGGTLKITGDTKNISTETDKENGTIKVILSESPTFGNIKINENKKGKITGLEKGTTDKDAVNLSQLKPLAEGLGATIGDDGTVTGPTYKLGDNSYTKLGDVFNKIYEQSTKKITFKDGKTTPNTKDIALGDSLTFKEKDNKNIIVTLKPTESAYEFSIKENPEFDGIVKGLGGFDANSKKIKNVAAGTADTDAVNFKQLKEIKEGLKSSVNLSLGAPVSYTAKIGDTRKQVVQKDGKFYRPEQLDNNGNVKENEKELKDKELESVKISAISKDGTITSPAVITNIADGKVEKGSTDAINGGQLQTVKDDIQNVSNNVKKVTNSISKGDFGNVVVTDKDGNKLVKVNGNYYNIADVKENPDDFSLTVLEGKKPVTEGIKLSAVNPSGASTTSATILSNVAKGVNDNDAVNVSQLKDFGLDPSNKKPVVTYDDDKKESVTLGDGNKPVTIKNVKAGDIKADGTDAVNAGQLYTVQETANNASTLANKGWNIAVNNTAGHKVALGNTVRFKSGTENLTISEIDNSKSTDTKNHNITLNLSSTPKFGDITINNNKEGVITGLKNKTWDENTNPVSGQAATEDQLKAVKDLIDKNISSNKDRAVKYDLNGENIDKSKVSLEGGAKGTLITNLKDGDVSTNSKDAVNGSQLYDKTLKLKQDLMGNTVTNIDDPFKVELTDNNGREKTYNSVKEAFESLQHGFRIATSTQNNKLDQAEYVAPNQTLAIVGEQDGNISTSLNVNTITPENGKEEDKINIPTVTVKLTKDPKFDTVNAKTSITVGDTSKQDNPIIKIDGSKGTISGLTNKDFDPTNINSGQAATEDQLLNVTNNINKKVDEFSDASPYEYTDGTNSLIKGKDGNFYTLDELKGAVYDTAKNKYVKNGADISPSIGQDKVIYVKTKGTDAKKLANLASGLDNKELANKYVGGDANSKGEAITSSQKVLGDLLNNKEDSTLNTAATLRDVQTLAIAGLDFTANKAEGNKDNKIHRELGTSIAIVGEDATNGVTYDTKNITTTSDAENDKIIIKLAKTPEFNGITIKGEKGQDGKDAKIGVDSEGNLVVTNGIDGTNGTNGSNETTSKVVTENTIGDTEISYTANKETNKKKVSLNDGFDFTNGTNTTAVVEDNGVVKFNLNETLSGIKSIDAGVNKAKIALGDADVTLSKGTNEAIKIKGVAKGTATGEAVNYDQLKDLVTAIGGNSAIDENGKWTKPTFKLKAGATGNTGNETKNYDTVSSALEALDNAISTSNAALSGSNMFFQGNDDGENSKLERKLGQTLKIAGEGSVTGNTAANNITVVKNTDGSRLEVKLAKNLVNIDTITTTESTNKEKATLSQKGVKAENKENTSDLTANGLEIKSKDSNKTDTTKVSLDGIELANNSTNPTVKNSITKEKVSLTNDEASNTSNATSTTITDKDKNNTIITAKDVKVSDNAGNSLTLVKESIVTNKSKILMDSDKITLSKVTTEENKNIKLGGILDGDISENSNEAINGSQLHGLAGVLGATVKVNKITAPEFTKLKNIDGSDYAENKTTYVSAINTVSAKLNEGLKYKAELDNKNGTDNITTTNYLGSTLEIVKLKDNVSKDSTTYVGNNLITKISQNSGNSTIEIGFNEKPEFKAINIKDGDKSLNITADGITGLKDLGENASGDSAVNKNYVTNLKSDIENKINNVTNNVGNLDESVPYEYTSDGNNSLVKGKNGKFYTKEELKDAKYENGEYTKSDKILTGIEEAKVYVKTKDTAKKLTNVASGIDKDKIGTKETLLDTTVAKELINGVNGANGLNQLTDKAKLNTVATVGDVQAVSLAGLDFTGNTFEGSVETHKVLGSKLVIKGEGTDSLTTFNSASGNIRVDIANNDLIVKLNKDLTNINSIANSNAKISLANGAITLSDSTNSNGAIKLKGVAKGENETDAVNFGQLQELNSKVNNISNGEAGIVVYTTKDGEKVTKIDGKFYKSENVKNGKAIYTTNDGTEYYKGQDNKFYKLSDNSLDTRVTEETFKEGNAKNPEVEATSLVASMVNPNGETKTPTTLENIASGIDKDKIGTDTPLTADNAVKLINGKPAEGENPKVDGLNQLTDKSKLNTAATVGDLQAVSLAGLDFAGNTFKDSVETHKVLGSKLVIKGEGTDNLTTFDSASGNIRVDSNGTDLTVKLNKDLTNINSIANSKAKISLADGAITLSNLTNSNGAIKLKGVAEGKDNTDAVNVGQLKQTETNINNELNQIKQGEKGVFVYTDAKGNRIVKIGKKYYNKDQLTKDGQPKYISADKKEYVKVDDKFYEIVNGEKSEKPAEDITNETFKEKNAKDPEVDFKEIIVSVVNPDGTTSNPKKIANVASGIDDTKIGNSEALLDTKVAKELINGKPAEGENPKVDGLNQLTDKAKLNTAATVGDLQAVSLAGLDFTGNTFNESKDTHKVLGSKLVIKGEGTDELTTFNSASGNIRVDSDGTDLTVKLNKDLENISSISSKEENGNKSTITLNPDHVIVNNDIYKGSKDDGNKLITKNEVNTIVNGVVSNATMKFKGDNGDEKAVKLGGTLNIKGSGMITTTSSGDGITIDLKDDVKDKINSISNGEAGVVVYTTKAGDKVTKIGDTFYKSDAEKIDGKPVYTTNDGSKYVKESDGYHKVGDDGKVSETNDETITNENIKTNPEVKATDIIASVVNPDGTTKSATTLGNIASGIDKDKIGTQDNTLLDATVAKELINGKPADDKKPAVDGLNQLTDKAKLNTAATVGDLQAVSLAGLGFTANAAENSSKKANLVHRNLGTNISIEGEAATNGVNYSTKNITTTTDVDNNKILIKIAEKPEFKGLTINDGTYKTKTLELTNDSIGTKKANDKKEAKITFKEGTEAKGETKATAPEISVNGAKITGVEAGTADTDAVNVSQLNAVKEQIKNSGAQNFDITTVSGKTKEVDDKNKINMNSTDNRLNIVGDSNIETSIDKDKKDVKIKLKDNINVNSITVNDINEKSPGNMVANKNYVDKQINAVTNKMSAGIAGAYAAAGIPQVAYDKLFSIGAAVGSYGGGKAIAVGLSGQNRARNFVYKFNVSFDNTANMGVSAGFNYSFGDNKPLPTKDLEKEIERLNKEVEELRRRDRIRYTIDDFVTDSSKITKEQQVVLEEIVKLANENYIGRTIEIVGYTDTRHTDKYNMDLGMRRAKAAKNALIRLGLSDDVNVIVRSGGYNEMVDGNYGKQRRVEILINQFDQYKK